MIKEMLSAYFLWSVVVFYADKPTDAKIEFENQWVRIVRVHYAPHEKTELHDHPAQPTVFVYVTDGGRLKIVHESEEAVIRPVVKAGGIRFQKGVPERHSVEELDGIESEYVRIELKTQPVELPDKDVRRAPDDNTPYESAMLRILRVECAVNSACPVSAHPADPAIIVTGKAAVWAPPNSAPMMNRSGVPLRQIRVELRTPPIQ